MSKLLIRIVVQSVVSFALMAGILLWAADDWGWQQGWAWIGEVSALSVAINAWLWFNDRGLLEERLSNPFSPRQRPVDTAILAGIMVLLLAWIALMGLDARRFMWTSAPLWAQIVGAALVGLSMVLVWETFRANPFASSEVRVQQERSQKVIDTGPYRYVRHPMYAGLLLFLLGSPLTVGSLWGIAGGAAVMVGIVVRTLGEEAVLKKDLPGYEDYMQKTPWRIVPGIW